MIGGREESDEVLRAAEQVGALIARRDAVLVCGGLGGVMEAACRGARKSGGTTVGILTMGDAAPANAYVDIVIPTDMGVARNAIIINSCAGVIAVGGSFGTLSEMAFALQRGIPIVSLHSWQVDPSVMVAESAEEAVGMLFERL